MPIRIGSDNDSMGRLTSWTISRKVELNISLTTADGDKLLMSMLLASILPTISWNNDKWNHQIFSEYFQFFNQPFYSRLDWVHKLRTSGNHWCRCFCRQRCKPLKRRPYFLVVKKSMTKLSVLYSETFFRKQFLFQLLLRSCQIISFRFQLYNNCTYFQFQFISVSLYSH